jgi:hypothetical protein
MVAQRAATPQALSIHRTVAAPRGVRTKVCVFLHGLNEPTLTASDRSEPQIL